MANSTRWDHLSTLDIDYAAVSQTVRRLENKAKRDKEVLRMKEMLVKRLKGTTPVMLEMFS